MKWDEVRADLKKLTGTNLAFSPFFKDFQEIAAKRPQLREPMLRVVDGHEADAVPQARLEDGAMDALAGLSRKAKLSLVTMQGRAACDKILAALGIAKFFASRFTREDSMDRPTQLRRALESVQADQDDSLFVGDRINDLFAARNVGIRFVMIRKMPDSPPADVLFRSVAEFAASRLVRD